MSDAEKLAECYAFIDRIARSIRPITAGLQWDAHKLLMEHGVSVPKIQRQAEPLGEDIEERKG